MTRPKLSDILELSIAERIELVQEIWDSIAESPEELPFTEEQKNEFDARAAELRSDPNSGALWEGIKTDLNCDISWS